MTQRGQSARARWTASAPMGLRSILSRFAVVVAMPSVGLSAACHDGGAWGEQTYASALVCGPGLPSVDRLRWVLDDGVTEFDTTAWVRYHIWPTVPSGPRIYENAAAEAQASGPLRCWQVIVTLPDSHPDDSKHPQGLDVTLHAGSWQGTHRFRSPKAGEPFDYRVDYQVATFVLDPAAGTYSTDGLSPVYEERLEAWHDYLRYRARDAVLRREPDADLWAEWYVPEEE